MFKKISKPTLFIIYFLIASFLVISSGVLITKAAQTMNSYHLNKNNGTNITASNPWDLNAIGRGCQTVTNDSGNDFLFLPKPLPNGMLLLPIFLVVLLLQVFLVLSVVRLEII